MTTDVFLNYLMLFGAPLLLIAIVAFVYRPSARKANREAKQILFNETDEPVSKQ